MNEYTYIDEAKVWVCNDCGASAPSQKDVQHYPSCKAGESKKWANVYNEEEI
jgi:rubrerythrin